MDGTSKLDTDEEEDEEVLQHQQDVCASLRVASSSKTVLWEQLVY